MQYILNSSLDNINGKECLHIFLNDKYSYNITINGEEIQQNEIYIKAPTLSNEDLSNIRRCSSVFSRFEEIYNNKIAKDIANLSDIERERIFSNFEEMETKKEEVKTEDVIREHVSSVLKSAKSYVSKDENFYTEFDKITIFLEKRLNRIMDEELYPLSFSIFDKHLGAKQFIIEEIFVEYVSFFFKHFPLESLLNLEAR